MLRLSLDKTSGEIKVLEGLVKTASARTLRLSLFSGGIAAQLASGESLTISAKPAGQTEADVLFSCTLTSADYSTTEALYLKTFTAYTTAALALLDLSDSNAKTDQASLVVDGYMSFTASGGDPVEYDQTYELTLAAVKALPSDGTPLALPGPLDWLVAHATRYLPAVTGLTGGGVTKLDGLGTVGVTPPVLIELVISDVSSKWLLKSGTDAVDGVGSIRPADYNASTNAKYWFQID